jgi:hypothetical protein
LSDDGERLRVIREWAETGIMRREWPLGDGTAVMLELRAELLELLGGATPQSHIAGALAYIRQRYGAGVTGRR